MAQMVQSYQEAPATVAPIMSPPSQFATPSLYVGDLDPSVSEAQLYDIFNHLGQVVSVRVCRDLMSKRSLGYAYVNFNNTQEAAHALETLNFTPINGKAIRIMFSHRDPSIRKSGTGNIFIKNLDKAIDNKALHDTFAMFGPILSCRVAMDENGNSKGYGYVQFVQEEAALTAIEKVNGMLINDKQVFVGPFVRRQEREFQNSTTKFNNVYVKNLAEETTDEDLIKVFGVFGPISSAVVIRDANGKSKCFGFVNFINTDDAAKAVENVNGKVFNDKEWYVGRAQKKSEREAELKIRFEQLKKERTEKFEGVNLYLKNLDDSIDEEKLREIFSVLGTVSSCKIMRSPQGQNIGSGFVTFSFKDEAMRAVNEMNGKMVGNKPLYVAVAQRKDERQAKLQQQFAQMRNMAPVNLNPGPLYPPRPPAMGHHVFYSQPPHGLLPPQPNGFGYQQHMLPGLRPGVPQIPNYIVPAVQRPSQQGQRMGNRRVAGPPFQQQQQLLMAPRANSRPMRYSQSSRATADTFSSHEMGGVLQNASESGLFMPALTSALASASPEQQRMMLGEQLYPLVDTLEHDHAGKVTGMLLEMDQTEVLHLIESPEALKAKVAEAMEVLQMAQVNAASPTSRIEHFASLSLNEQLAG